MSRELELKKYCDICRITGSPDLEDGEVIKEPATTCFTVGIVEGESRPVPKVVDVCADHVEPLADLLGLLADVHQLPGDTPKTPKAKTTPAKTAPVRVAAMTAPPRRVDPYHADRQCPVCHQWKSTANLAAHVWKNHRNETKPPIPNACPECGRHYRGAGMASHRRLKHDFDAVAFALEGVPGYTPAKALPAAQLELTGT